MPNSYVKSQIGVMQFQCGFTWEDSSHQLCAKTIKTSHFMDLLGAKLHESIAIHDSAAAVGPYLDQLYPTFTLNEFNLDVTLFYLDVTLTPGSVHT